MQVLKQELRELKGKILLQKRVSCQDVSAIKVLQVEKI